IDAFRLNRSSIGRRIRYARAMFEACRIHGSDSTGSDARAIRRRRIQPATRPQSPTAAPELQIANTIGAMNTCPLRVDSVRSSTAPKVTLDAGDACTNASEGSIDAGRHDGSATLKTGTSAELTTAADKTQCRNAADFFRNNGRTDKPSARIKDVL